MPKKRIAGSVPSAPKKKHAAANKGVLGELKLDDLTRMNLLRLDSNVKASQALLQLQQLKLRDYILKIDKDGVVFTMQADLLALGQQLQVQEADYRAASQKVEEELGIKLKDYSFDETSGTLHKHNPAEATQK